MFLFKFLINNSKKVLLSFCLIGSLQTHSLAKGFPKEYYEIKDSEEAKKYFFEHLYNLVLEENLIIKEEKRFVNELLTSNILNIDFDSTAFYKLLEIKQKYKIKNIYTLKEYQKKIDIVPPSMALAQAAVESAWGRSRFVKEANNIFGHWTYNSQIGMIPRNRDLGATHFIRIFQSLKESVTAYMLNLNRNLAYKSFQEKRFELKKTAQKIDGLELSQTVLNYSGIAQDYLKILKDIIVLNNLQDYDNRFYQQINN